MSLKTSILEYLENNRGESISGENLANNFGVSRSAVWKAVNALRDEGHDIEAVTNKGYMLSTDSDLLTMPGISKFLNPEISKFIQVYKEVDSTNEKAKALALEGADEGTVIVADTQSAGKGRMGRKFESPSGAGIYMSMILRPRFDMRNGVLITTAAAVAVCRAIKVVTDIKPGIKWVNDIYVEKRKVAGILTEGITDLESGTIESVIVGIGLNFKAIPEAYPKELLDKIGWLFDGVSPNITRNEMAAAIINELWNISENLEDRSFISEYKALSILLGRDIFYIEGGQKYPAKVVDIDDNGALIVENEGVNKRLSSGEISIRW